MSESPEEIRADIERTRSELSGDVDALADKVSPTKALHRQTNKVKSAASSVKDRVFGASDDASEAVSDAVSSVADGAHAARDHVVEKAEGNPIAVGLMAFGAGLLLSSLIPASAKEKELASGLKEHAEPVIEEAKGVAQEIVDDLKEPTQAAAASVRDSVEDSVEHLKEDGRAAAESVRADAQESRDRLTE